MLGEVVYGIAKAVIEAFRRDPDKPNRKTSGDEDANRGYQLFLKREFAAAVTALESALKKGVQEEPLDTVYTCLGNAYSEVDRLADAVTAHKKALELNPDSHQAWVNLGICHRLLGDYDEAEACYQKAIRLNPDYAELHASLGALYIHKDRPYLAVESLETAIELDNQLAVAYSNLALAYAMTNQFDEADHALKRAIILGYPNGPIIRERIDALRG